MSTLIRRAGLAVAWAALLPAAGRAAPAPAAEPPAPSLELVPPDVAAFLQWASDPKMEERKQTGLAALIFILLLTGLLYGSYRQIWRDVEHGDHPRPKGRPGGPAPADAAVGRPPE